jgi:hypothetical protein
MAAVVLKGAWAENNLPFSGQLSTMSGVKAWNTVDSPASGAFVGLVLTVAVQET